MRWVGGRWECAESKSDLLPFWVQGGVVEPEVAIFDWQWTGPGVGATDVVYLCAMALSDETLDNYERDVLAVYHEYLCIALGAESGANDDDDDDDDDDDADGHDHEKDEKDEKDEDVREEEEEGVEVVAKGGGKKKKKKKKCPYPMADLRREFDLAALDYQRWQGGSRMPGMTPASMRAAQDAIDVNHGIYRRSLRRMKWVWQVVDGALDRAEQDPSRLS